MIFQAGFPGLFAFFPRQLPASYFTLISETSGGIDGEEEKESDS
jgi:hypothetical protein